MTQLALADFFGTQRPTINKHLGNIYATGELVEKVVVSILEHTTPHIPSISTARMKLIQGN